MPTRNPYNLPKILHPNAFSGSQWGPDPAQEPPSDPAQKAPPPDHPSPPSFFARYPSLCPARPAQKLVSGERGKKKDRLLIQIRLLDVLHRVHSPLRLSRRCAFFELDYALFHSNMQLTERFHAHVLQRLPQTHVQMPGEEKQSQCPIILTNNR